MCGYSLAELPRQPGPIDYTISKNALGAGFDCTSRELLPRNALSDFRRGGFFFRRKPRNRHWLRYTLRHATWSQTAKGPLRPLENLSKSRQAAFVVADPDSLINLGDKNLTVADFARPGRGNDGHYSLFQQFVRNYRFEFDFRQEIDCIFTAAIELGMPFLAPVSPCFKNGHAFDAYFEQGVFYSVEFGWLNDSFNFLHSRVSR